jgi:hypothetical protein
MPNSCGATKPGEVGVPKPTYALLIVVAPTTLHSKNSSEMACDILMHNEQEM